MAMVSRGWLLLSTLGLALACNDEAREPTELEAGAPASAGTKSDVSLANGGSAVGEIVGGAGPDQALAGAAGADDASAAGTGSETAIGGASAMGGADAVGGVDAVGGADAVGGSGAAGEPAVAGAGGAQIGGSGGSAGGSGGSAGGPGNTGGISGAAGSPPDSCVPKVVQGPACQGTLVLGTPPTFRTGGGPRAIVTGDFDNDDNPDVAVADDGLDGIGVFLGNGNGTFQGAQNIKVADEPVQLATGFFDKDDNLDVVSVNWGPSTISVLLGNGDGSFQLGKSYDVGFKPSAVAVGLFNADGFADLAVTNYSNQSVSILLGNGDGTFALPKPEYGFSNPTCITTADFNADKILDLAVGNSYGITIKLGKGNGTFSEPSYYPVPLPSAITVGYFDADASLDLAVSIGNSSADLSVQVLLGQGDGKFGDAVPYAAGENPKGIAAADLDGDGVTDLVAGNGSVKGEFGANASVLLGNGDGTFGAPSDYISGKQPVGVATADFDRDGQIDVVTANHSISVNYGSADVSLLLGRGDGSLVSPDVLSTSVGPDRVESVDVNHDCIPDFVVSVPGSKAVNVLLGKAGGGYQPAVSYPASGAAQDMVVGDFTGDGELDIELSFSGGITRLTGNGDGTFGPSNSIGGGTTSTLTGGDFDGDGKLDTALASNGQTKGCVRVNLSASQTWSGCIDVAIFPEAMAAGDLDGNDQGDLVVADLEGIKVLLGKGGGALGAAIPYGGPTSNIFDVALGDVDGDDDLDIVTAGNDNIAVLLNDGSGKFPKRDDYPTETMVSSYLTLADLDGDGALDIAGAKRLVGNVGVLRNDGKGKFGPEIIYPVGSEPYGITSGDFDLDGVQDLAVAASGGSSLTVLKNRGCIE